MINFDKINSYINHIENGTIPENMSFNEFFTDFFLITQHIPLSKYLRSNGFEKKIPKIMNSKKAGEVLTYSLKDPDIEIFFKRNGFKTAPELNYKVIMVLRKGDNYYNWKRVFDALEGKKTIQEITERGRSNLLPQEILKLETYAKENLKLNDKEFTQFMSKFSTILNNKELLRALKKLSSEYTK